MSRGLNKASLIGRLGSDVKLRRFPDGTAIVNVAVATKDVWKDRETGERKESTEWHRVVFKNRLAEIADQYLSKGSRVYVEGKLKTRKWTTEAGVDQYVTEIHAFDMQMLDPAPATAEQPAQAPAKKAEQAKPKAKTEQPAAKAKTVEPAKAPDLTLDDLEDPALIEFDEVF